VLWAGQAPHSAPPGRAPLHPDHHAAGADRTCRGIGWGP